MESVLEVEVRLPNLNHNSEEEEGRRMEAVAKEEEENELTPRVAVIVVSRQRSVEENVAEMENALSKAERESVIKRSPKEVIKRSPKEGTRKAQRILLDPTGGEAVEGPIIRKAPWMELLDPTEELLSVDQTELKPSHHSTPLLPTSPGIYCISLW